MKPLCIFLWPILWWGFSAAMYCAEPTAPPKPAHVLVPTAQFEQLEALAADMQAQAAAEKDVEITDEAKIAQLKTGASQLSVQLSAAKADGTKVSAEMGKLESDLATEKRRAWHRLWIIIGQDVVIVALLAWIFKKPLARMCGIPMP